MTQILRFTFETPRTHNTSVSRVALIVVWLVAASLTGALAVLAYELSRPPVVTPQKPLDELPKARHEANPWAMWSVTEQLSAHHVLIVQVETRHLDRARAIAQTIVDPILPKENFAEILIYFHRPGRPDPLAPRRVQWTPTNGYVETVYAP